MSIAISSGNTTQVMTDSDTSSRHYQVIKIADGSPNSSATVSASALYGLQVDVSRMPSAALLGIPSVTANVYNIPSVAANIYNTPSVTANIYNNPSVAVVAGLNVSASQVGGWNVSLSGSPSVTLVNPVNASITHLGIPSVSVLGGYGVSAAITGMGLSSLTLYGTPSVGLFGNPSVTLVTPINVSASQFAGWNVSLSGSPSVTLVGISSVAMVANPSVTVGALYGTPSVAPTTHSVTAMIYNSPSVAITGYPSVAALRKYLNITNAQAAPIVLWSNIATTRWVLTDLIISSQYSTTVTVLDGIDSIGRFYFAACGGLAKEFTTPWKSGGIGSNIMITTAGTSSVDCIATGYETA